MSIVKPRRIVAGVIALAVAVTSISMLVVSPASAAVGDVKINEIESSGGVPGDWVELYNTTATPVDVGGYIVKDNDDTHIYTVPLGTTVAAFGYFLVEEAQTGYGLGAADSVRLFAPDGVTIADSHTWAAHAPTSYGRCPDGTGSFVTMTSVTKGAANDCGSPVKINEVESSGGAPGDWVELYNPGPTTADISGFVFRDNDDTHTYTIPAAATIAPGGYYVLDEAVFGFGLGAADSARLFTATLTPVDSYTWASHAATTYGRCPNGTGAFATTATVTKGATNACTGEVAALPWPGDAAVQPVDGSSVLGGNMSGLVYEGSGSATPGVLWAAKNGPGALYRLVFDGSIWTPDPGDGWGAGKPLRYPGGSGNPDAEGVTFAGPSSADGMYVATERNNDASGVSRNSILRVDPTGAGATLEATREWDLTADLPAVGPNLGMEAITWIPDTFLVSRGFFDESKGHAYLPAEYPNHGDGLFFVGLEANGTIYAYALDHVGGGFTRIATISSGFVGVMGLEFDRDLNDLWAVCDDGCAGRSAVLRIDATTGRFVGVSVFDRPATMPNINNEGFAIAPATECVADRKPAFWADDAGTDTHAIRRGTLPCTGLGGGPAPVVPELPIAALSVVSAAALLGGWFVLRRGRVAV
jgi:hypothetical protein